MKRSEIVALRDGDAIVPRFGKRVRKFHLNTESLVREERLGIVNEAVAVRMNIYPTAEGVPVD